MIGNMSSSPIPIKKSKRPKTSPCQSVIMTTKSSEPRTVEYFLSLTTYRRCRLPLQQPAKKAPHPIYTSQDENNDRHHHHRSRKPQNGHYDKQTCQNKYNNGHQVSAEQNKPTQKPSFFPSVDGDNVLFVNMNFHLLIPFLLILYYF